jgi:hypothetical protein
VVADDLAELCGPTTGVVSLPHRLAWQPPKSFDLDVEVVLRLMYERVLREAVSVAELSAWLDGPTLVRVWRQLHLPTGVRRAWEAKHPALRAAA